MDKLSRLGYNPTEAEIHLYSWIALILYVYSGNPVSDWTYSFAATKWGAPFSDELHTAFQFGLHTNYLSESSGIISLTPNGERHLQMLNQLPIAAAHQQYVTASCQTSLLIPPGYARRATSRLPQMHRPSGADSTSLMSEYAMQIVYDTAAIIRTQLEQLGRSGLVEPAYIWLKIFENDPQPDV